MATAASMSAKRKRNYAAAFKLQVVESAERTLIGKLVENLE